MSFLDPSWFESGLGIAANLIIIAGAIIGTAFWFNGETPADRAGIKVEGQNKWLTLIQNASHAQAEMGEKAQ